MSESNKPILVTSALPYANGPLHLGHMVEHIQTNIWMRTQRLNGRDILAVCGEDAHGTPIMLKAEAQGITPEALVEQVRATHLADFADFNIDYDQYHSTHSTENRELSTEIYLKLRERGDISTKEINQAFDPEKKIFLPDRYVKGTCPRCGVEDQYGDNCEACGATYSPTELKNPRSAISGAVPIEKSSEHYFFELSHYQDSLQTWINQDHLQSQMRHKLNEWFEAGLKAWDISRDAPYFGFEIPDAPGKYFYVWLDAPIGYMASFKAYCDQNPNINFADYWHSENKTELYHFIGKDIVYFHALFWPAILSGSGHRRPTAVFAHGYLTINGEKMSKSRGTFITARDYLENLDADYLRYYFAAKLNSGIEDIDLNLTDFMIRVNTDLVGKYVNIASRCAKFINKKFDNTLSAELADPDLYQKFIAAGESISQKFITREYSQAVRDIMALADLANQYIDQHKPWALDNETDVHKICSLGINLFRVLTLYLSPIVPGLATRAYEFLNTEDNFWTDAQKPLLNHQVKKFTPLLQRITEACITKL